MSYTTDMLTRYNIILTKYQRNRVMHNLAGQRNALGAKVLYPSYQYVYFFTCYIELTLPSFPENLKLPNTWTF